MTHVATHARHTAATVLFGLTSLAVLGGCSSVAGVHDAPLPGEGAADTYWALDLRDHAINLSVAPPSNTLRLTATARNAAGAALAGVTATPTYVVQEPERLAVTAGGVLTALEPGTNIRVVASWPYAGITHADTAYVTITATAPASPLATFSIQPPPGDSAKWSISLLSIFFGPKKVAPVTLDAAGHPVNDLLIAYTSSRRGVATVLPDGTVSPRVPGTTLLTASTYAYGVRAVDSLPFVIGLPTYGIAKLGTENPTSGGLGLRFTTLTVGVGAVVSFQNCSAVPQAVVFDDAAGVSAPFHGAFPFMGTEGGNIASLDPNCAGEAYRQFDHPGTYRYQDGSGHVLGTVVVRAE